MIPLGGLAFLPDLALVLPNLSHCIQVQLQLLAKHKPENMPKETKPRERSNKEFPGGPGFEVQEHRMTMSRLLDLQKLTLETAMLMYSSG